MDPHGDVMVDYKVNVTRVRFVSHPVKGMLRERAWGGRMAGRNGDLGGAKLVLGGTFVPKAFICFGLFNILHENICSSSRGAGKRKDRMKLSSPPKLMVF
jgi:hypothetical protein